MDVSHVTDGSLSSSVSLGNAIGRKLTGGGPHAPARIRTKNELASHQQLNSLNLKPLTSSLYDVKITSGEIFLPRAFCRRKDQGRSLRFLKRYAWLKEHPTFTIASQSHVNLSCFADAVTKQSSDFYDNAGRCHSNAPKLYQCAKRNARLGRNFYNSRAGAGDAGEDEPPR
ncbi:hypothetical protein EVAR_45581_1 [Eumeta japonica]|uniref:Uncharacterized protein n=1 Tax=Eumeta variegata TaxID=151549 RepID=A0A4C1YZ63_EUMVA|nr:hypothetical protein EVAR_45581_1 [Eumeta japonica]